MPPKALITGIAGMDGSYLAEFLLIKGYEVHGTLRRQSSIAGTWRINAVFDKLHLHHSDVTDGSAIMRLVDEVKPDEIYHLAAQSHVGVSFETPDYTANVDALGTLRMLEAMRCVCPKARFYQASTSELFGTSAPPQNELTAFQPQSPYACAKLYAHHTAMNYRQAYNLHVSCGILFNHESPRRGETFITRKISRAIAAIKGAIRVDAVGSSLRHHNGKLQVGVGNLRAKRDWGWAPEYVQAMWSMLQAATPDDYVIATGESHSVEELCEIAFERAGLDWRDHVYVDEAKQRPLEVWELQGDAEKAWRVLDWSAHVRFAEVIRRMVDAELKNG